MKKISSITTKFFQQIAILIFLCLINSIALKANIFWSDEEQAVIGRWDITIDMHGKPSPSWLEIHRSGFTTLVGEFVGSGGSARPVSKIYFKNNTINFSIPPQWEKDTNNIFFAAELRNDSLFGTMIATNGEKYNWVAVRAPSLQRTAGPVWQNPVTLFDGNDLKGWHATGDNQWVVKDGVLSSPHSGSNLMTDETFNDFRLHIEFRYPEGSNSGVYLRGHYEVQIEASHGDEPPKDVFSAIYGFIAPSEMTAKKAGEWQTYDITLIGRMVTVVANGKTVICNREIPGITGGAINSNEGEPGPIFLQGDHGPIDYRNIVITPAK